MDIRVRQLNMFEPEKPIPPERPRDPVLAVNPEVYVRFNELRERGGDAGLHLIRIDGGQPAVYLRYHSTPLWKYGGCSGIRADIVEFCERFHVARIYFENLHPSYRSLHSVNPAILKSGTLENVGGKGLRYYLPLDCWKDEKRLLEVGWTNRVTEL